VDAALIQRVNELRARFARGEREALEPDLRALPRGLPPALARRVAELWSGLERWDLSAECLEPLAGTDPRTEARLTFARNMAALAEARPELYDAVRAASETPSPYVIDAAHRVCVRDAAGALVPLIADPIGRAEQQWDCAIEMVRDFGTLAVVGAGDGYLLAAMSNTQFDLPNGMTQPVVVIEPDLQRLATVLMMHDYSQDHGIIRDPRGRWCVGADWSTQLRALLVEQAAIHLPRSFLITWATQDTQRQVLDVVEAYRIENDAVGERNMVRDARRTPAELEALLGDEPPRPPRVLLVTSDFTRVLKHATASLADAFASIGWETHVLTEGASWQRLPRLKIRRTLERVDPDTVVIINHARPEYGSVYPPNLPFVTWVQDQMPNLESEETGRQIGPRDFVMTGMQALEQCFGYPSRQVVRIRCLARSPRVRPAAIAPAHDLVYVSHCSIGRDELRAQFEYRLARGDADPTVARAGFDALVGCYDAGGSVSTSRDLIALICRATGVDPEDTAEVTRYVAPVSHTNIVLYRQQALRWAADVSRARGLDLAIYGQGWEALKPFAAYARGPVAYGDALDALARRARFNLVLEPFPVTSHWRGLDCMAAGAMPLVRRHPYTRYVAELARSMDLRGVSGLDGLDEVYAAAVTPREREQLDELVRGFDYLGVLGDPVQFVRRLRAAGGDDLGVPPGVDQVSFEGPEELSAVIDRWRDDMPSRESLIAPMQAFVREHLSYAAGLRHLLGYMRTCLASEPSLDAQGAATLGTAPGFLSSPVAALRAASSS